MSSISVAYRLLGPNSLTNERVGDRSATEPSDRDGVAEPPVGRVVEASGHRGGGRQQRRRQPPRATSPARDGRRRGRPRAPARRTAPAPRAGSSWPVVARSSAAFGSTTSGPPAPPRAGG